MACRQPPRLRCLTHSGNAAVASEHPAGQCLGAGSSDARADLNRVVVASPSARQGNPTADASDDRETRMAKGETEPRQAAQPEFVQLLSPDGERIDHPDYDVEFTDEEFR